MAAYEKFHEDWEDLPSTATPITAEALEHIETGIATAQATADASVDLAGHTGDTTGAHAASAIAFTPTGTIAGDDVQEAVAEVAVDAAAALSAHEADTTSVHGIADTSALYRSGGTDVAVADGGTGASTAANARTNLGLVIGTDVQAHSAVLAATTASFTTADETKLDGIEAAADVTDAANVAAAGAVMESDTSTAAMSFVIDEDNMASDSATKVPTQQSVKAYADLRVPKATFPVAIGVAMSDETTAITTGTAKVTMRAPFAFTLTAVRASLTTASSSGTPTVDINEAGTTVLSTKLTIDANEKTSTTAATAAVISDSAIADDAELTFDVDVAGTGAKGLKVWLIGTRAV